MTSTFHVPPLVLGTMWFREFIVVKNSGKYKKMESPDMKLNG